MDLGHRSWGTDGWREWLSADSCLSLERDWGPLARERRTGGSPAWCGCQCPGRNRRVGSPFSSALRDQTSERGVYLCRSEKSNKHPPGSFSVPLPGALWPLTGETVGVRARDGGLVPRPGVSPCARQCGRMWAGSHSAGRVSDLPAAIFRCPAHCSGQNVSAGPQVTCVAAAGGRGSRPGFPSACLHWTSALCFPVCRECCELYGGAPRLAPGTE